MEGGGLRNFVAIFCLNNSILQPSILLEIFGQRTGENCNLRSYGLKHAGDLSNKMRPIIQILNTPKIRGVADIRIYEYPRIIGEISRIIFEVFVSAKYSYFYTNIRTIRNTNTSWIRSIRISIRITIRISIRGYEYFVDTKYPYKYSYKWSYDVVVNEHAQRHLVHPHHPSHQFQVKIRKDS